MTKPNTLPALDYLKSILNYDPLSGEFIWRSRADRSPWWNNRYGGKRAGYISPIGYCHIGINDRLYAAHRLAWIIMTGEDTRDQIDHIDCNKSNNAFANLRRASHAQNQQNRHAQSNSASGIKGVCWHKGGRKWAAKLKVGKRYYHLGLFDTIDDAASAYAAAVKEHHGAFARTD